MGVGKTGWRFRLGAALIATSLALMGLHYAIFRDAQHLAFWGVHGIAMLPLEVFVVTMIINAMLERRAREATMRKLNMVIGAFFAEVGSELLRRVIVLDDAADIYEHARIDARWDARRYAEAKAVITAHTCRLTLAPEDLQSLKEFIIGKRPFLLGLLQNPNLLEHDTFTDVLWAVTHLSEELEYRADFGALPEGDVAHLMGDMRRAYVAVASEWLDYAQHLQQEYPYLFSLAVRTNPLDPRASVVVAE